MTGTQVADPLIGTLVDGRYRVRERVARGGMATVYLAVDERLDRTVALKIVHPAEAGEPRFVDRFIDEAKAIARLTHPNVVAVYDQGTHDGLPYLIMEFVRGRTLREVLAARRRLTPVEALAVAEQMLAAIAAAHRAGLVHRDVKPENVLVAEAPSGGPSNLVDSVVKVADFGLAQAVQASAAADAGGGQLMATAAYVAPELVTAGRADPRSDVYSAGIVLFEMLTGRVPFDGDDASQVAYQHVDQAVPPPSRHVAGLPPAVDDLVIRATRRDPAARPTDAGAFLNDVQVVRERALTRAPAGVPGGSDATVVMRAVPATERPPWARLPDSARTRPPGPRRGGTLVASTGRPPSRSGGLALRGRNRVFAAAFLALLVLLLALGGWWLGVGRWTQAPELVGLARNDAVALAQSEGLRVEVADERYDDEVPAGQVISQDPTGRVRRGGTITVTLSLGPEIFPVPDVVGATLDVARRQLEDLGLRVVEGEGDYSNTVPADRVVSVDPGVGAEVGPGTEITVVVSLGRAPITVPSLLGQDVNAARAQLEALSLVPVVNEVDSNDPAGRVLAQDPGGGAGAVPGDEVRLDVSRGPPVTPVPDVTGQPCAQAAQVLQQAGFQVVQGIPGTQGPVQLQDPSPGTGLPPGSQVTIWCALR